MAGEVDIINLALTAIGAQRIMSIDDNQKEAAAAKAVYPLVLESELAVNRWNFASERSVLPALAEKPKFGFKYYYELPSDCLRLYEFGPWIMSPLGGPIAQDTAPWVQEGNRILTNLPPAVNIIYAKKITNFAALPALFVNVYRYKLASELSITLSSSQSLTAQCLERYQLELTRAKRAAVIYNPPKRLASDTWEMAGR
jgi:hypothetical protein